MRELQPNTATTCRWSCENEWRQFCYPLIIGGFGLAERAKHSTLGCKDEHDVTMLNLAWQSPTLRYRWFTIGSHALLDILMKYQKSKYITTKSKFTNLVLTTRNVKLTWKLGFSDVKWRVDRWSWKLICISRHCVVKVVLWSNFYPLVFRVYQIEFHEKIKTPFTDCKYLHYKIFNKFENWVKYANEMTDDVIHSTQYYIECINKAISANLQCSTLKLGRLIVLQETHIWL